MARRQEPPQRCVQLHLVGARTGKQGISVHDKQTRGEHELSWNAKVVSKRTECGNVCQYRMRAQAIGCCAPSLDVRSYAAARSGQAEGVDNGIMFGMHASAVRNPTLQPCSTIHNEASLWQHVPVVTSMEQPPGAFSQHVDTTHVPACSTHQHQSTLGQDPCTQHAAPARSMHRALQPGSATRRCCTHISKTHNHGRREP